MIERTFQDIPDGKIDEADQHHFLISLGWSRGVRWSDLLQSQRVLITSEAGTGKTHECRVQAKALWEAGEPAFFVELAALSNENLRSLLDDDEEERLDRWLCSQSENATFFLDSFDELQLTLGSFERALKRLKKDIKGQLSRAKIIITTRPIPFDEKLVRQLLPIPPVPSSEANEERFAKVAMGNYQEKQSSNNKDIVPEWRSVALIPLSDKQITEFAHSLGVEEPELLMEDLHRRNAQEFARRPQDLIELCADWREHKRIRTHREQVTTNIRVKLLPRYDRCEPAELSVDKAIEGASRLALAMLMMRRFTIRHSAASDVVEGEAALDPALILSDWQPKERKALLERSLFGFASYGRVRFHHRSVAEFLAAQRLLKLREQGMSFRTLKRLLFAETKGKLIVRPSKRAMAGWLGKNNGIFELLRDNEPAVLLDEGDPESLTEMQRNQVLRAYCERYGSGGWRGLWVPHIQVHRFASIELANEINRIWHVGVENPEVRQVLLDLIKEGRVSACVELAYNHAVNINVSVVERINSLEALVSLEDERLEEIAVAIATADKAWSEQESRDAVILLYPKYMSVEQLCQTLRWIKPQKRSVGSFTWQLSRLITAAELDFLSMEALRDELVILISEGIKWQKYAPHITSERSYLSGALAAICGRGLEYSQSDEWLHASLLAVRLHRSEHDGEELIKKIRELLSLLPPESHARLFWVGDALQQSLCEVKAPWDRLYEITPHEGPIQLRFDRDYPWISDALRDTSRDVNERGMLLEAAIRLSPDRASYKEYLEVLKSLIIDDSILIKKVDDFLKPSKHEKEHRKREQKDRERREQEERRKTKKVASWILLWREINNNPDDAFSSTNSRNTALNLWKVMRYDGGNRRASGWNRRFIEELFCKEVADRLRSVLMKVWREESPVLPSERAEDERNNILVSWLFGLAAVYAEAEDPEWANKLSHEEAKLAARLTTTQLSNFPEWMETLVRIHPEAVDQTLGNELSCDLKRLDEMNGHSSLLQEIYGAPECVAILFLPRLVEWLRLFNELTDDSSQANGRIETLRQVTNIILKYGNETAIADLLEMASQRLGESISLDQKDVWLPILMRLEPSSGVTALEGKLAEIDPEARTNAVTYLAKLFGDRWNAINLNDECFAPQLLLRLLRLAYHHVRIQDDAQHEGSYSTDTRDEAEYARNAIVVALFNAKGEEGWRAKLEMAADPLCKHFKDRILAVTEENWAQEIDAVIFNEEQAVALDRRGEAAASSNETMFTILKDRLSDIEDLLLQDTSPREAWAGIKDERVMRREIARELSHAANSIYTVDQEAVTADEKETDIRLRSTASNHEAIIELKLGDKRTAKDLRDTIEKQLVKKYMAAERSRSGVLLVTLSKNRKWKHPDENRFIYVEELLMLLRKEAGRVQQALGGSVYIDAHILDLRPRLPTEAES